MNCDELERLLPEATAFYQVDDEHALSLRRIPDAGESPVEYSSELLRLTCDAEIKAALQWANAIWQSEQHHYVLPSGDHAEVFVRFGDVLTDWLNIERIADWIIPHIEGAGVVIADSPTLVSLLKELQLRVVRQRSESINIRSLGGYDSTRDEIDETIAEANNEALESDQGVLVLISVDGSGKFASRIEDSIRSYGDRSRFRILVLCDTAERSQYSSLCYFDTEQYPAEQCYLCDEEGLPRVHIEPRRLVEDNIARETSTSLPSQDRIEKFSQILGEIDDANGFAVHQTRGDLAYHYPLFIDTGRLLQSQFQWRFTRALGEVCEGFPPDIVLVPDHPGIGPICEWLHGQQVGEVTRVPRSGRPGQAIEDKVRSAKNILLCDDAVITTRTMRALLQYVQRVKGAAGTSDYEMRALTLLGRTEDPVSWEGLKDRFFIDGEYRLRTGAILHLPEPSSNRGRCPWCVEREVLETVAPELEGKGRSYVEMRLARLGDEAGLRENIFLGSELESDNDFGTEASHVTPHSYLGNLSDVGTYAATSLLIQDLRNSWRRESGQNLGQFVLDVPLLFRRFTDPVIIAGILRAVRKTETPLEYTNGKLGNAIRETTHSRRHAVMESEVLWAVSRRILPRGSVEDKMRELLKPIAEGPRVLLEAIL